MHASKEEKHDVAPDSKSVDLFTASEVARFCQVDLKTIHNWAERGTIRHFRTPGRHLRFRREDVLDFLRRYGYPIPETLRAGRPKVVAIEGNSGRVEALRGSLDDHFEVTVFGDPFDALIAVGSVAPDALVLDLDLPGVDGLRCIERLRAVPGTSHIRCVVLSRSPGEKARALGAGAYDFLDSDDIPGLTSSLVRLLGVGAA